jgi:hypothetical protein
MPKATVRANAPTLSKAKSSTPGTKSTEALLREAAEFAAAYPILKAVGAHRNAHRRFERAVEATDDTVAQQEARAVTDADEAEWDEAGAAEARALRRLVRTRPTTVEGLRALIGYSVSCFRDHGWDEATLSQLLMSIMESAPLRVRPKSAA